MVPAKASVIYIFFKYCADVENCDASKGFGFIYIYIYIFIDKYIFVINNTLIYKYYIVKFIVTLASLA